MADEGDMGFGFFCGVIITFILGVGIIFLLFAGAERDLVNTKEFGEILCQEYNLTYDYRTFDYNIGNGSIPIIHCKEPENKTQKEILDGIVIQTWTVK